MIKLTKTQKPQVLEDNATKWTTNLVTKVAAKQPVTDSDKSHYRHAKIKEALVKETHGKCAYCESKLLHIAYGDVEHITPKSSDIRLTFEWENLTLACDVCNTKKGAQENVIDPYDTDPSGAFVVYGAFVLPQPGNNDALYYERILDLNRVALLEMREKRIKELHQLVCLAASVPDDKTKAAIKQDILTKETLDSVEFAAVSRKYLSDMLAEKHL